MPAVDSDSRLPSIEEQIEALIHGKLPELRKIYRPRLSQDDAYRTILTFRSSNIVRHLAKNYQIKDLLKTEPNPLHDGFYAIRTPEGFEVYYQERGARVTASAPTEDAVWVWFANWLLATSGTGLKFE